MEIAIYPQGFYQGAPGPPCGEGERNRNGQREMNRHAIAIRASADPRSSSGVGLVLQSYASLSIGGRGFNLPSHCSVADCSLCWRRQSSSRQLREAFGEGLSRESPITL